MTIYARNDIPFAREAILTDYAHNWLPSSINLTNDIKKWKSLSKSDAAVLFKTLLYFTQSDVEVCNCYTDVYQVWITKIDIPDISINEIKNMLCRFASMEVVHQDVYDKLVKEVGIEPGEFLKYKELRNKHEYFNSLLEVSKLEDIGLSIMVFGGFLEGVLLYSAFAIIKTIATKYTLSEIKAIVEYSMRDEDLHSTSLIELFHFLGDHKIYNKKHVYILAKQAVYNCVQFEFMFLDELEREGCVSIDFNDLKHYILDLSNRRLQHLQAPYTAEELFKNTKYSKLIKDRIPGSINHSLFTKEFEIATSNTQKSNFLEGHPTEYSVVEQVEIDFDNLI